MAEEYIAETQYGSALWDCACGREDIYAQDPETGKDVNHCPGCGRSVPAPIPGRGIEGNPYRTPTDEQWREICAKRAQLEAESGETNWSCEYCGSGVSPLDQYCFGCGSSKDGEQYTGDDNLSDVVELPSVSQTRSTASAQMQTVRTERTPRKGAFRWIFFPGVSVVVLVIAFLIYHFVIKTEPVIVEVAGHSWSRAVDVDQYTAIDDEGWSWDVPEDAYGKSHKKKIHKYRDVIIGYEDVEVEKSKRIDTGQTKPDCKWVKKNLGNGVIQKDRVCKNIKIYKTHTWTETVQEPIKRTEAVYERWYTYIINRWRVYDTLDAGEDDRSPYWPHVDVYTGTLQVGDFRITGKRESYYLKLTDISEQGVRRSRWSFSLSEELWEQRDVGMRFTAMVNAAGQIRKLCKVSSEC